MEKPTRQRKSKTDLLKRGLEILAGQGVEGVTIDALCTGLGVTKGSFYHHFKSRDQFHASLLEFWMEEHTERKKALADEEGTPEQRYVRIVEYATTLPHELEKNIRAWAMRNTLAADYLAKVDGSRIAYLEWLLKDILQDETQARPMATIVLSTMIGSRLLSPPILGDARRELLGQLHTLMGIQLPSATNSQKGAEQ
ncbi:TetR/AcrR family transcriptional regulator [uncultured Pseudodesulfovibrio sp.]|uniref:TetR/AcrR family transcriptional regulator n=1 Tax=uncultured Pseudodesulfovibrio sp. TaxID=2035858 RepID=UPI0029C6B0DC|nr:TetR/AcrR family transcriptional regulator [uncultured Pseudodesulfovibrio sp.]